MFNVTQGKYAAEVDRQKSKMRPSTFWGEAGVRLARAIKEQARETLMGPIEREIRKLASEWSPGYMYWSVLSGVGFDVCVGAAISLGVRKAFLKTQEVDPDVLSEAIEAAEALGL